MVVAVAEDSVQAVVHLVVDEVAAVAEEVDIYTKKARICKFVFFIFCVFIIHIS
jgi:hypothetical protein